MVESLVQNKAKTVVLVPAGKEPETYQATPAQVAALSRAELFFRTGIPVEETLLPKLQSVNPHLRIIDLREGLPLQKAELHHHEETAEPHEHSETDPHIWLSPALLKQQAAIMSNTLKTVFPDNAEFFQENAAQLLGKIETLQSDLQKEMEPKRGKTVFVFHPAYGYFCSEFGLVQSAIEFEGKPPTPQKIASLVAEMKKTGNTPVIFVQPEFNQSPAKAVAEAAGGKLIIHSPLEYDVLKSIRHFADSIP
ncbi:adhesin [Planctomycetales bacterium]|nr:adhesin [Planctomycetales bacterium]